MWTIMSCLLGLISYLITRKPMPPYAELIMNFSYVIDFLLIRKYILKKKTEKKKNNPTLEPSYIAGKRHYEAFVRSYISSAKERRKNLPKTKDATYIYHTLHTTASSFHTATLTALPGDKQKLENDLLVAYQNMYNTDSQYAISQYLSDIGNEENQHEALKLIQERTAACKKLRPMFHNEMLWSLKEEKYLKKHMHDETVGNCTAKSGKWTKKVLSCI